ncbi:hypothetical protein TNCV_3045881 [Trichonephila clavipes]|uniref:Uncharacterized protein n=1 Tax=Trichonephila clavipes TaxID=2585209 RepID=A0A8X6RNY9_TRICX|nr:hypothetical protein TNCV_3045881 [Trichonephila clavipes]
MSFDLIDRIAYEQDLFSRLITGDESRIFEYYPETKRQRTSFRDFRKHPKEFDGHAENHIPVEDSQCCY